MVIICTEIKYKENKCNSFPSIIIQNTMKFDGEKWQNFDENFVA